MTDDALLAEMEALRERVTGITGSAIASRDGLSIRDDTGGVDADNMPLWRLRPWPWPSAWPARRAWGRCGRP